MLETCSSKFLASLTEKCVFRQFCPKNTIHLWKLRFTPSYVENWLLPNLKLLCCQRRHFASNLRKEYNSLLKVAFHSSLCWKLAFPKFSTSLPKTRYFASNLRKQYNLLLTWIQFKLMQRMQDAPENCILIQFVLKTGFCKFVSLSCQKRRFAFYLRNIRDLLLKTTFYASLFWKLGFAKYWDSSAKKCFLLMKSTPRIQLAL